MSKFKVGDRVEFIGNTTIFNERNGDKGTVVGCSHKGVGVQFDTYISSAHDCDGLGKKGYCVWRVNDDNFKIISAPGNHSIHITCTDGKTTHAVKKVDGKIVARSKAVCCPTDEFNANIGAQLAFNRLVYGTDYHPSEVAFKCKPKQEPEYLNMRVVCVEEGFKSTIPLPDLTPGKVYQVSDGVLTDDSGYCYEPYSTLQDICSASGHKFIEFKGE